MHTAEATEKGGSFLKRPHLFFLLLTNVIYSHIKMHPKPELCCDTVTSSVRSGECREPVLSTHRNFHVKLGPAL